MKKRPILTILLVVLAFAAGYYTSSSVTARNDRVNLPVSTVRSLSSVATSTPTPKKSSPTKAPATKTTTKPSSKTNTYILNTSTKKFHIPSCSSVKQMKEKNKKTVAMSRDEVIKMGYDPCGRCHP